MAERLLTRVQSIRERLDETLLAHRNDILAFLTRLSILVLIVTACIGHHILVIAQFSK